MKRKVSDKEQLDRIIWCIALIDRFSKGVDFALFERNFKLKLALVKLIETIGEVAVKLNSKLKENFSEVDWQGLILLRNRLIEQYHDIDYNTIWKVVQEDTPALKNKIQHILDTKFPEQI